jgi:sugar O-acyltransferase (sialic acid O-acetyltransferase NeuD family)
MEKIEINLIGAGGHANVINAILTDLGHSLSGVYDDHSFKFKGKQTIQSNPEGLENVVIAIGDNKARKEKSSYHNQYVLLIHPSVLLDKSVAIGIGSVLIHGSIVQAGTIIGEHVIVNTNATIDHDCNIGDFTHIAPNATLCGNVSVGEGTLIGASVTVLPGVKIGKWCVVGAGSVVNKNLPDFSKVAGIPAKKIK